MEPEPKRPRLSASAEKKEAESRKRAEAKKAINAEAAALKLFRTLETRRPQVLALAEQLDKCWAGLQHEITLLCTEIAGTVCHSITDITKPEVWTEKMRRMDATKKEFDLRKLQQSFANTAAWTTLEFLASLKTTLLRATIDNRNWVNLCHATPFPSINTESLRFRDMHVFDRDLRSELDDCTTEMENIQIAVVQAIGQYQHCMNILFGRSYELPIISKMQAKEKFNEYVSEKGELLWGKEYLQSKEIGPAGKVYQMFLAATMVGPSDWFITLMALRDAFEEISGDEEI